MIYSIRECDVFYFIIFNYFYSIVRFVKCSCVCMKYVNFVFWGCEFVRFYVIFVFCVSFNFIVDQSFIFGDGVDWDIF